MRHKYIIISIFSISVGLKIAAQNNNYFPFDDKIKSSHSFDNRYTHLMKQGDIFPKLIAYTAGPYQTDNGLQIDSNIFEYDARGNKISSTRMYLQGDTLTPESRWIYDYDAENRLISEGYEYWEDFEFKAGGILELFIYNEQGKLHKEIIQNYSDSLGYYDHQYIDYAYNENNLLITVESTVFDEGILEPIWKNAFYYDFYFKPYKETREDFIDGNYIITGFTVNQYTDFDSIETATDYSTYNEESGSTDTILIGQLVWGYTAEEKIASLAFYTSDPIYCDSPDTLCITALAELIYINDSLIYELFSYSYGYGSPLDTITMAYHYLNAFQNTDSSIYYSKYLSPEWEYFSRYDYYYEDFNTEINSVNEIAVYPNPFSDHVTFDILNTVIETVWLDVYDVMGKRIFSGSLIESNLIWYPVYDLPGGIYFYDLIIDDKIFTGKMMKV